MAYQEKRYGKRELKIMTGVVIALAIISIVLGVVALVNMDHWTKYIIAVLTFVLGIGLLVWGVYLIIIVSSTHDEKQSVRDGNQAKGIANASLCDKCGREIDAEAIHCEHCGAKQVGKGTKNCEICGAKNKDTAEFCKKCGAKF